MLSHVWFFATLWTVAHQAPLSMGISRQQYWSGLPFPPPGDLPHPVIEPVSPALQADTLLLRHNLDNYYSQYGTCDRSALGKGQNHRQKNKWNGKKVSHWTIQFKVCGLQELNSIRYTEWKCYFTTIIFYFSIYKNLNLSDSI